MKRVTLLTGGARSGKSRKALKLCEGYSSKAFIATAQALDEEMKHRIALHQDERGQEWTTIEEPVELVSAIKEAAKTCEVAIVDCLTVWMGNLTHYKKDPELIESAICSLLKVLEDPPIDLVLVTNEVGMGIVPADQYTRTYRDQLGGLNQRIAAIASSVQFMVCGIPVIVKGNPND